MQTHNRRGSGFYGRAAYFNRIAGDARHYLGRAETDLNHLREQARKCSPNVPDGLRSRIVYLERRVKEYRDKMNRALHNAGRQ